MTSVEKKKDLLTKEKQLQYSQATLNALGHFDVEYWTDGSDSLEAHSTAAAAALFTTTTAGCTSILLPPPTHGPGEMRPHSMQLQK